MLVCLGSNLEYTRASILRDRECDNHLQVLPSRYDPQVPKGFGRQLPVARASAADIVRIPCNRPGPDPQVPEEQRLQGTYQQHYDDYPSCLL